MAVSWSYNIGVHSHTAEHEEFLSGKTAIPLVLRSQGKRLGWGVAELMMSTSTSSVTVRGISHAATFRAPSYN